METINFLRLFLLLFFISCNSQHQFHKKKLLDYGKYINYRYTGDPFNSESIIISEDNKVNYDLKIKLYGDISLTGNWSIVKDTLKFSFEMPPIKKIGKIKIDYGSERHSDSLSVKVNDSYGIPYGSAIFIDNDKYIITFKEIKIKPRYISKIKAVYGDDTYEININKFITNDITSFTILTESRDVIYDLVTTKWLIRENRIIEINGNKVNEKHYLIREN